jgi:hypothetical protein
MARTRRGSGLSRGLGKVVNKVGKGFFDEAMTAGSAAAKPGKRKKGKYKSTPPQSPSG